MAKTPKSKVAKSVNSTTNPKTKNKQVGDPDPLPMPCSCCPDCAGKASGTMGACEDGVCRDIPPPQGTGPWVLYWNANVNQGFPYWESLANLAAEMQGAAMKPPPMVPPPEPEQEVM